jgi:hypothetical protein
MNARPNNYELNRIRKDISSAFRAERDVMAPAPQSLIALLKELETRVRDAELERLYTAVDARVADLLRAVGREPCNAHGSKGGNGDETIHVVRPQDPTLAKSAE